MNNPFTPMFGTIPPVMVGRDGIEHDVRLALEQPYGNPNAATLLVGARGTGKTALLGKLVQIAQEEGWIAVTSTALPGMLDDILVRTRKLASHRVDVRPPRKIKSFTVASVGGFELEDEHELPVNWRSEMEDLLKKLEAVDSGLLIAVDEVDPTLSEIVQLVSTFQHFTQEGRRVSLVLAGLPASVDGLISGKHTSFLRRARKRTLGSLSSQETRQALKETIVMAGKDIETDALTYAAAKIEGFPYLLQLAGYEMWLQAEGHEVITKNDVDSALKNALPELAENVYGATMRELSMRDRDFLLQLARLGEVATMAELAKNLGVSSSYANNYKRRLLRDGLIEEPLKGQVRFALPNLRSYVLDYFDF